MMLIKISCIHWYRESDESGHLISNSSHFNAVFCDVVIVLLHLLWHKIISWCINSFNLMPIDVLFISFSCGVICIINFMLLIFQI